MRSVLVLGVLVVSGPITWSAEGVTIRDLRLLGGVGHAQTEVRGRLATATDTISYTGRGDSDDRTQIAVGAMTSLQPLGPRGGFIIGAELDWQTGDAWMPIGSTSRYNIDRDAYGFTVHAGWAYAPRERFHVEVTPFAGLAYVQQEQSVHTTASIIAGESTGRELQYGIRGGLYETFGNRVQVGLEIRYARESGHQVEEITAAGGSATDDTHIRSSVVSFLIGVGYRL